MNKKNYIILCLVLGLFIPAAAFGWGSATHAYLADQLGKSSNYLNQQEIYGAMVPDFYKMVIGRPYYHYLDSVTHIQFERVVSRATTSALKSFAYGYASHNEVWGADFTAHHEGRTTPGMGYILAQVALLKPMFADSIEQVLLNNQLDPDQAHEIAVEFGPSIAHVAAEIAVDLLIKRAEDPQIGQKISQAGLARSSGVPALLVSAYASDLAREYRMNILKASAILISAEQAFRAYVSYYGYVFSKPEPEAIQLLANYAADLAELFIKLEKNLDIDVPSSTVEALLQETMKLIEPSYAGEIAATLDYLKNQCPLPYGSEPNYAVESISGVGQEHGIVTPPLRFSLGQNQPNPFNPLTTIEYSLANDGPVRITVYNSIGQLVAVLVDEFQSKGIHRVEWNALHQPSGLYIYRLETDGFSATKKMFLQK